MTLQYSTIACLLCIPTGGVHRTFDKRVVVLIICGFWKINPKNLSDNPKYRYNSIYFTTTRQKENCYYTTKQVISMIEFFSKTYSPLLEQQFVNKVSTYQRAPIVPFQNDLFLYSNELFIYPSDLEIKETINTTLSASF